MPSVPPDRLWDSMPNLRLSLNVKVKNALQILLPMSENEQKRQIDSWKLQAFESYVASLSAPRIRNTPAGDILVIEKEDWVSAQLIRFGKVIYYPTNMPDYHKAMLNKKELRLVNEPLSPNPLREAAAIQYLPDVDNQAYHVAITYDTSENPSISSIIKLEEIRLEQPCGLQARVQIFNEPTNVNYTVGVATPNVQRLLFENQIAIDSNKIGSDFF